MRHRQPNWSPDHTRIAYAAGAFSGNVYGLWILDLRDGSQTEFVAATAGLDRPTWSPDGTQIAYGAGGDLWVKNVDDTDPLDKGTQITDTASIIEERPVWSPDGKTLYYNRGESGKQRDIYSKSPVTLAGAEIPVFIAAADDWQPAVSPDGKRLCFLRGPQNDLADLDTVSIGTGVVAPFSTTLNKGDLNCVWSPDGSRILYTEGAFGLGELRTKDINGGSLDQLPGLSVAEHFDGNADWATNFPPKCDQKNAQIGVNQFTTITLSCTDPDFGPGADPPTPTPLESEALEIAMGPSHGAIGSLNNGKVIYTPNKDFQGTDSFTYTGSDGTSNAVPASVTIQVGNKSAAGDKTPPGISAVKVSAKKWRLGNGLAKISKAPVGTTISFESQRGGERDAHLPERKAGKEVRRRTASSRRAATRPTRAAPAM